MVRLIMLIFAVLTFSATLMTYNNVGLEKTKYEEHSIRSGSRGYGMGGSFGSGGFRGGK